MTFQLIRAEPRLEFWVLSTDCAIWNLLQENGLQHHFSAAFTNILAPFALVSGCKFQSLFSPHLLLKALRVAGKSHSLQFPLPPRCYSLIFVLTSFGLQSSLYTDSLHTLLSFLLFLLLPLFCLFNFNFLWTSSIIILF